MNVLWAMGAVRNSVWIPLLASIVNADRDSNSLATAPVKASRVYRNTFIYSKPEHYPSTILIIINIIIIIIIIQRKQEEHIWPKNSLF